MAQSKPVKPWWVYLVKCADGTLYVGITTNIDRRIKQHNTGKGSKYIVKSRRPVVLLATIEAESRSAASSIEYVAKNKLNRAQKFAYFGVNNE